MSEQTTIEIADDSYDCHATDNNWRYGLYLDPEARRVSHWEFYGTGTPERVWHNRAVIADLPRGAVGEHVREVVDGDEFRGLVEALFELYQGSEWNGSNHVGRWSGNDEYGSKTHELELMIEALFEHVPTYWDASDWFAGGQWGESDANDIRVRMQRGETLEAIAEEFVADARNNDAYLDDAEVLACIESLLEQHPVTCDCPQCDCDEPATTTDDAGNAVCDACSVYMALDSGDNVCSQQTEGFTRCHECGETIDWSGILTGQPGVSNYRLGDCACGERMWQNEENGGSWDRYGYGGK